MNMDYNEEFTPQVIDERGTTRLGFPTGVSGSDYVKSGLETYTGATGWIVRDETVEEWKLEGFTQRDGQVYFIGPYAEGSSLDECLRGDAAEGLARLKDLVGALIALDTVSYTHLRAHET